jgi:hypothetical protein
MRKVSLILIVAGMILTVWGGRCVAQDFKPYPGAKLDEKGSTAASAAAPGKKSEVYTTNDSYEKVYAFYKEFYKEYVMPVRPPNLAGGQELKWAFFILDGEKDLKSSKYWIKVQHPYVGGTDGKDIRDVTVIQTVQSK